MTNFFIQITTLILCGICLIALMIVLESFFPRWIEQTRRALDVQPGTAFLLGIVNWMFFGSITIGFFLLARATPVFVAPAIFINIPLAIATTVGIAGIVALTGARIFPDHTDTRRTVLTTAVLYAACLTPFIGWFLLTGFIGVMGLGGFLLGFLRFRRVDKPVAGPTGTAGDRDRPAEDGGTIAAGPPAGAAGPEAAPGGGQPDGPAGTGGLNAAADEVDEASSTSANAGPDRTE